MVKLRMFDGHPATYVVTAVRVADIEQGPAGAKSSIDIPISPVTPVNSMPENKQYV